MRRSRSVTSKLSRFELMFPRIIRAALTLLGLVFLLAGLLSAGLTLWSSSWPLTRGTVLSSTTAPRSTNMVVDSEHGRHGMTIHGSTAIVRYRYTVDGRSFESSRVSYAYGPFLGRAIPARFEAGREVDVSYRASHPDQSVLIASVTWSHAPPLILATLLLLDALGVSRYIRARQG